jgi:hypothetical protein
VQQARRFADRFDFDALAGHHKRDEHRAAVNAAEALAAIDQLFDFDFERH